MKMLSRFVPWCVALLSQPDKQQHVVCSFVIYLVACALSPTACALSPVTCALSPVAVALALTLFIGLLKEVWDKYYGTGFCYYDLLSNCIGVGLAMPVGYLINASILL